MSLIKKANVKDYFAKGSGRKVLNFRSSTQPDATGYSGSNASARPEKAVQGPSQDSSREVTVIPKEACGANAPIVDKATQA